MVAIPHNAANTIGTKIWTQLRKIASSTKADILAKASPDLYTPVANTLNQRVQHVLQTHNLPHGLPSNLNVYKTKAVANQPKLFNKNDRGAVAAKNLSSLYKTGKLTEVRVVEFDTPAAMQAKLAELAKSKKNRAGANNSVHRIGGSKDMLFSAIHYVPLDDRHLIRVIHAETGPKLTALKTKLTNAMGPVKNALNGLLKTTLDTVSTLLGGLKQTAKTTINPNSVTPKG